MNRSNQQMMNMSNQQMMNMSNQQNNRQNIRLGIQDDIEEFKGINKIIKIKFTETYFVFKFLSIQSVKRILRTVYYDKY